MTIQRLLVDPEEQANLRDRVLIVDEAGMVSARQMTGLLELAEQQTARVVFSGDTRQLQSVEAGDALRILERESGLGSVSLTQVQRQTTEAYREAIEALREDPARGFEQLEQMGAVRRWRGRIARDRWPRPGGKRRLTGTRTGSRAPCWSSARHTTTLRG
jgi:ATP-dependent exoDNAse (exonuclease V) alpha subunit